MCETVCVSVVVSLCVGVLSSRCLFRDMRSSAQFCIFILLALACAAYVHATHHHSDELSASGTALIQALRLNREQLATGSVRLPQQHILNPRGGVAPAEEGTRLYSSSRCSLTK